MKTWYTDNIGVDFEYICAAENETVTKAEDVVLRWVSPDVIDDKSTLTQVMSWRLPPDKKPLS